MKKITLAFVAVLFSLTITAQTTVKTDSITQLTTCSGGTQLITFKTTGSFTLGNTFIAQISNGFGQFTNPINIGSTPFSFGTGIILATFPKNLPLGLLYKIRVISTNPADTSVSPSNIIILTIPTVFNKIVPGCKNDTVTLSASLPGSTYKWSTGATTQSIQLSTPGTYSVTTKDPLAGCKSTIDTTINTIACTSTGIDENTISNLFTLYPNPNNGICNIAITNINSKDLLISVVDILGKEVFHLSDKNSSSEYKKEINLEHLATGIYSIKLTIGNDCKTRKLIIQ